MTEERRQTEARLLAALHSTRAEYDELSAIYIQFTAIATAAGMGHGDGTLALARSTAAHAKVKEAMERHRVALREFAAVVVYGRWP